MNIIILDTNFIITCAKQKIYFEEEIKELIPTAEIVVPLQVKNELRRITEGRTGANYNDRRNAELALRLISKFREIKLKGKYVDNGIVEHCGRNTDSKSDKIFVATIDARLARKVKSIANVIKIRKMKKLMIE
ncbi:hypothetical protein J4447_04415 [Candidatus Pacearchaeota archaeon]|nr:hypothetical protein [Candidatus Pacearchaeota archaeon]